MKEQKRKPVSLAQIFGYALGEGAVSITMNGISNFAMLYYTQVLGQYIIQYNIQDRHSV